MDVVDELDGLHKQGCAEARSTRKELEYSIRRERELRKRLAEEAVQRDRLVEEIRSLRDVLALTEPARERAAKLSEAFKAMPFKWGHLGETCSCDLCSHVRSHLLSSDSSLGRPGMERSQGLGLHVEGNVVLGH